MRAKGILILVLSVVLFAVPVLAQERVAAYANAPVREIDDPNSGIRWLLFPPEQGGPGRLVPITASRTRSVAAQENVPLASRPVIRAGDSIVLEEHTSVVDASFAAIALGPAAPGGVLRLRLAIGGHVLSGVAAGPGRAVLDPEAEPQP